MSDKKIIYPMMSFPEVRKKYNDETGKDAIYWESGKGYFTEDYVQ